MENSRRCDPSNIEVHRASYAKHLRSKEPLENIRRNDIFIPEWFCKEKQTSIKNKITKI